MSTVDVANVDNDNGQVSDGERYTVTQDGHVTIAGHAARTAT